MKWDYVATGTMGIMEYAFSKKWTVETKMILEYLHADYLVRYQELELFNTMP